MSTIREDVLRDGIELTTGDRNRTYGSPVPNLALQLQLCELYRVYREAAGAKHTPAHDAAMQHIFAKIARIACGAPLHRDNYVDLATYAAIAYECDMPPQSDERCDPGAAEPNCVCDKPASLCTAPDCKAHSYDSYAPTMTVRSQLPYELSCRRCGESVCVCSGA